MLMARGDVLSFKMKHGKDIVLPPDWVMLHDPSGRIISKCTLVLCKCELGTRSCGTIPDRIRKDVEEYFGSGAELSCGAVDLPKGPWHSVGVVREILYDRHGEYEDSWYHPYKDTINPVELFANEQATGYRLVLPDGCQINERGFVWP